MKKALCGFHPSGEVPQILKLLLTNFIAIPTISNNFVRGGSPKIQKLFLTIFLAISGNLEQVCVVGYGGVGWVVVSLFQFSSLVKLNSSTSHLEYQVLNTKTWAGLLKVVSMSGIKLLRGCNHFLSIPFICYSIYL